MARETGALETEVRKVRSSNNKNGDREGGEEGAILKMQKKSSLKFHQRCGFNMRFFMQRRKKQKPVLLCDVARYESISSCTSNVARVAQGVISNFCDVLCNIASCAHPLRYQYLIFNVIIPTHPVLAKNEKCRGGTRSLKAIISRTLSSNNGLGDFCVSSHHSTDGPLILILIPHVTQLALKRAVMGVAEPLAGTFTKDGNISRITLKK